MLRSIAVSVCLASLALAGCAGAPPTPAKSPTPPAQSTAPPPAPVEAPKAGPSEAEKVPPPPAECTAFAERKPTSAPTCTDKAAAHKALAAALEQKDVAQRDGALVNLEACTGLPPGMVRALRAELAPPECGDVLVDPVVEKPPVGLTPDLRDTLMGLGYAAKASRLVRTPPQLAAPFGKARVRAFVDGPLKQWIEGQAKAIQSVSLHGSSLTGYGKGVVAVEAGLADLRFVNVARQSPIPDDLAKDPELKDAYYGSLEQALDPRKRRGRDAALVGLKKLSQVGIINDPRVDRARHLLSELYAGRRIDALDSLLLPRLPAATPQSDDEKLARLLPTFYASIVLRDAQVGKAQLLRSLIEQGLFPSARVRLEKSLKLSGDTRRYLARAEVDLARRYWLTRELSAAVRTLSRQRSKGVPAGEVALTKAVARALVGGPKDAADMMLNGPRLPKGVGDVAELDALGKKRSELGGMALFDAARLLEIARPQGADAAYFDGIAERYEKAAKLLKDPEQKADAAERGKAARATAKAVAH